MPHFIGRLAGAGPRAWVVLALGLCAAVLMIATEFSTMQSVRVGDSTCGVFETAQQQDDCEIKGGEQHAYALVLLGLFTGLLAFGAAVGRSRPAALALLAVGAVVLFIAFVLDRPTLDDVRGFDVFSRAVGEAGGAYTLERIAGALALLAGLASLGFDRLEARRAAAAKREERRPRRRPSSEEAVEQQP
jgi:hypothetical protein